MKYIDAEKLYAKVDALMAHYAKAEKEMEDDVELSIFYQGKRKMCSEVISLINSLQQEQPMPDSTKLIELWHEDKEMLKEKDFRDDPWRLAYNAFLCGFVRGIAVNKQEQPEVDLSEAYQEFCKDYPFPWSSQYVNREYIDELCLSVARHFYELGLRRAAEMYDDVEYKRQRAQDKSSDDLEEAAREYAKIPGKAQHEWYDGGKLEGFKAGAEWMASQMPLPEDTVIFQKGVEEGKRLMMEDALEGVAHPDDCEIWVNLVGYGYDIKDGDKVKVIIVEEEK